MLLSSVITMRSQDIFLPLFNLATVNKHFQASKIVSTATLRAGQVT